MESKFSFTVKENTVYLEGRLFDIDDNTNLFNSLSDLLSSKKEVTIDLKGLEFLNSTGLNTFIKTLTKARNLGKELQLINVSEAIKKLFIVTKLTRIFNIKD